MATITVKPTNSAGIQSALDKTGTYYGKQLPYNEVHFTAGNYPISSRMFLNSNTRITCDPGVYWNLENVNFGVSVPVVGQKESQITGLDISGINFNGRYASQTKTPGDHGQGYGTFIQLQRASNSKFHHLVGGYNEGDFIKVTLGKNVEIFGNKGIMGGHDFIHAHACDFLRIYDNNVDMRANNAVRLRGCKNTEVFRNSIYGSSRAYAPGIQVECRDSYKSTNLSIHDNLISGCFGPDIWIIATVAGNTGISIRNNKILKGGLMPASNKISGVGGIVCDGFNAVTIENNIIDGCYGYGVMFGKYLVVPTITGLSAIVRNNTIKNTKKSFYAGTASGTGIADLTGSRYSVATSGNIMSGNVANYYKVP